MVFGVAQSHETIFFSFSAVVLVLYCTTTYNTSPLFVDLQKAAFNTSTYSTSKTKQNETDIYSRGDVCTNNGVAPHLDRDKRSFL